jgi:cephalosporin hydroxylase
VARVTELVAGRRSSLVSLDSDHRREHVARELEAYSPLTPVGGYLCVFDGIAPAIARSGMRPGYGESAEWLEDNPLLAVADFLARNPGFTTSDRNARLGATFAPGGLLLRSR